MKDKWLNDSSVFRQIVLQLKLVEFAAKQPHPSLPVKLRLCLRKIKDNRDQMSVINKVFVNSKHHTQYLKKQMLVLQHSFSRYNLQLFYMLFDRLLKMLEDEIAGEACQSLGERFIPSMCHCICILAKGNVQVAHLTLGQVVRVNKIRSNCGVSSDPFYIYHQLMGKELQASKSQIKKHRGKKDFYRKDHDVLAKLYKEYEDHMIDFKQTIDGVVKNFQHMQELKKNILKLMGRFSPELRRESLCAIKKAEMFMATPYEELIGMGRGQIGCTMVIWEKTDMYM